MQDERLQPGRLPPSGLYAAASPLNGRPGWKAGHCADNCAR